jgi:hypothetical protein
MLHRIRSFHLSVIKSLFKNTLPQDGNKGGGGQLPGAPTYNVTGIVGNMVLVNLGFHTGK